jgi:hypothetical protein
MAVRKLDETGLTISIPRTTEEPETVASPELTDVDSVRQYMQKTLNDKLQDEDVETLIYQASEAVQRYTSREFTATNNATRSFEWTPTDCYDILDLAPYELRAVTSVNLDADTEAPTTLTGLQYRLRPYPPRDGTFFGLRLSGLPLPKSTSSSGVAVGEPYRYFTRRLSITGNWGMAQVPPEVQHYTNLTVKNWAELHRDPGLQSGEFGEGAALRAEDLPIAARFGLKRWMRPEALV